MPRLDVPAVAETADALLPAARRLIDDETATLEADPDVAVTCGPDCNACCAHAVVASPAEQRDIAAAVAALAPAEQRQIADRAAAVLERVRGELGTDPAGITDFDSDFSRRYYGLAEPCPLLIGGRCAVREVRPLVCREYLMSSPRSACEDRSLEHAVRIRRRRRVSTAFRRISADFGDEAPRLLPMALVAAPPVAARSLRSGPRTALGLARA